MRKLPVLTSIVLGLVLNGAACLAADDAGLMPAGVIGESGGSGSWPALIESREDLRSHTIYRPQTLPDSALPVLLWGNGGCADNGFAHRNFLREIASHGYYVIALGHAWAEGVRAPEAPAERDATDVMQMVEALDWAARQNSRQGSALYAHLDLGRIAVAGHSCGGLQAIKQSADPRIATSMIFNSGVYNSPGGRSKIRVSKTELANYHGPVAYITGGPGDVAHPNALDDVARIDHVPVYFGWLPVGHGGTFSEPDGGAWAQVAVRWLNWHLKADTQAASWFSGPDCGFCQDPRWTVERFVTP